MVLAIRCCDRFASSGHIFCSPISEICHALPELQDLGAGCTAVYTGCQQALKHLHLMMFKPEGEPQVCNK